MARQESLSRAEVIDLVEGREQPETTDEARAEVQTVELDGMVFDAETGEFLRLAYRPEFRVVDVPTAEWVLEKASKLEADELAYTARLNALKENLERMAAEKRRQRQSLMSRFGPEIEQVAKANLPHGKKTFTCAFGSVAFRATAAKLEIQDKDKALEWAEEFAPEAVKVEKSVLKSMIPAETASTMLSAPAIAAAAGFAVVPAGESVTIKTGVAV